MVAKAYVNLKTVLNRKRFAILFLSTYILIAALPILVLGLVLNQYLLEQFSGKIQERDLQMLRQYETSAENYFKSLERLSTLIYLDSDLSAYRLGSSPLNAMEGIESLRKYITSYPYVQNILLYSFQEDRFYTTETSLTLDDFFKIYSLSDYSAADIRRLIQNNNSLFISQPQDMKSSVTFNARSVSLVAMPVPLGAMVNDRKIIYILDLPGFNALLSAKNTDILVFTADGHLLSPYSSAFANDTVAIMDAIKADHSSQNLQLGERDYFMQSLVSEETGLIYVSLVDRSVAYSEVDAIRRVMLVVVAIMAVVLVIMIIFSKQMHLNPLQSLFDRALRLAGRPSDQPVGYQTVSSAFDYMIDQQETIKTKYDSARCAIREHLLTQLLGNEIISLEEFNELGRDVGLHFTHDAFCIAILRLDHEQLRFSRHQIADYLEIQDKSRTCYTLQMPDDRIIAFYCLNDADSDQLPAYFAEVSRSLAEQGLTPAIGVGNVYPDISHIAESCAEAESALDYQSFQGGGVLFFKLETGNTDWFDLEYPTKKIQLLEALLLEGDTEKISSTVDEISEFMERRNLPLSAVRCLSYDMINTLLKTMRVISRKYAATKSKIPDIMALSGFTSSAELKKETQRICLEICEEIRKSNESRVDNLAIRLLDYVNQNYCSINFSICAMANDLDLSLSLVNTCFKKFMDKTPLEYVNEMRLNMAKHLLTTTSLPLNDITRQVGYIDTPSFLRKFHKLTGITPGQYRKLQAEQKD